MATDAEVLNALRAKLVMYEGAGMADHVKKVKARIAELEKGGQKAPANMPMVLTPEQKPVDVPVGATVTKTEPKAAPKKTAGKKK